MLGRVLILSASAGAGHLRAAQAIEQALLSRKSAKEVRNIDTLDYTNPVFRNLYSKTYLEMVNRTPELLGWLYDHMDKPGRHDWERLTLEKLNTGPFVKMIEEYQPDVAICTHPLPAELISWLRSAGRIATKQAIVVTDFDIHMMWLCDVYERYFVALEETRVHLHKLGVPPEKVSVTGIPIDPVFAEPKDQAAMRKKYGLQPDLTTILVSAGGFGVGPIDSMMANLRELEHPAQVIALCGRNVELKARLDALVASGPTHPHVKIHPIGYTTKMDEYMAASDLLLGKPGGLTTSEGLAKGLIFVIVNPIPGQESRNSDYLLENGAAIKVNQPSMMATKIQALLDDPKRLADLRTRSAKLGHPEAAYTVARAALGMVGMKA